MKQRIRRTALIAMIVAAVLVQAACGTKSIPQYTADAGDAVKSFLDASKVMYDSGAISKATYAKLLDAAEKANKDTDTFKATAVQLGIVTGDNKKPLEDKINDAITIFRNVGNSQITDAAQQQKFNAILGAIQTAYLGILAGLSAIKKPTPVTPKIVAQVQKMIDGIAEQVNEQREVANVY